MIASSLVTFDLASGQLARKGRVQILLEDPSWSALCAATARTDSATPEQFGEGSLQELEFERLWIKFDGQGNDFPEILADFKCQAKQFLENALVSFGHYPST